MDLISELPEAILHNILHYRLPLKDAMRTCVLSKKWRGIQGRCPFLEFSELDFNSSDQETRSKKDLFMNYIDSRLGRFVHQNLPPLVKFHLKITSYDPETDSPRIDSWLRFVLEEEIQRLDLVVYRRCTFLTYSLPQFVLTSETLTRLCLVRCALKLNPFGQIKFPKLRKLLFSNLDVDDDFVKCLILGCPLLKHLILFMCGKLTNLQITSLPWLKIVELQYCSSLRNVEIKSPKFRCFEYRGINHLDGTCVLTLAPSNETFRKLTLGYANFPSAWLQQQISRCEELVLYGIPSFGIAKISSEKLRKLTVKYCTPMTKVADIDCPNLISFLYSQNQLPFHSVKNFELQDISLDFFLEDDQQRIVWLEKLKSFSGNFSSLFNKKLIKIVISSKGYEDEIVLDGLIELMLPILNDVKELMPKPEVIISSMSNSMGLDNLVNGILSNTPKTINVASIPNKSTFPEVLYDKLSKIKAEGKCCAAGVYRCHCKDYLCAVDKDSTSNSSPSALRNYQSEPYQITRFLLEWRNKVPRNSL